MPKPKTIISQADLVRISGATKQAINKAIGAGHIQTKKVKKRTMVIFDHELTQLWYKKEVAKSEKKSAPVKPGKKADKEDDTDSLISLNRKKTEEQIKDIIAGRKLKELKFRIERENLIEKESLASVIFQYLNALNNHMLDLPDMVIDTMIDKIRSGTERGDLIKIMRDMIQKEIKNTKDQIKERLK